MYDETQMFRQPFCWTLCGVR